jgi:hypothetical protein
VEKAASRWHAQQEKGDGGGNCELRIATTTTKTIAEISFRCVDIQQSKMVTATIGITEEEDTTIKNDDNYGDKVLGGGGGGGSLIYNNQK